MKSKTPNILKFINKIRRSKKLGTLPKNTNVFTKKEFALAFAQLKNQIRNYTKDPTEALLLEMALDKASAYGPLLDTYELLEGRVEDAKKFIKSNKENGKTGKTIYKNAYEIIIIGKPNKKGERPVSIDWPGLALNFAIYIEKRQKTIGMIIKGKNGKNYTRPLNPHDAIDLIICNSKHQSRDALIKGLKRYRKETPSPYLKEALKSLPYK
jgi:hypothetical protein